MSGVRPEQAKQAGAGLVDEIKRLREVKARLEAENQQQALALTAIADAEAAKKAATLEEAHRGSSGG